MQFLSKRYLLCHVNKLFILMYRGRIRQMACKNIFTRSEIDSAKHFDEYLKFGKTHKPKTWGSVYLSSMMSQFPTFSTGFFRFMPSFGKIRGLQGQCKHKRVADSSQRRSRTLIVFNLHLQWYENQYKPMCKKSGFVILSLVAVKKKQYQTMIIS